MPSGVTKALGRSEAMNEQADPRTQLEDDPDTERVVKTEIDEGGGPDPEVVTEMVDSKGSNPDVKTILESDEVR